MNFRRLICIIGAIASFLNQVLDIIYAYKTPYHQKMIFNVTCISLIVRLLLTIGCAQYFYTIYVRNYKPKMGRQGEDKVIEEDVDEVDADETGKTDSKNEAEIISEGQTLYGALHLLYYTGFYRILPSFDFRTELKVGYSIEIFISLIPMLFCQIFNNYATEGEVNFIQKAALWMKLMSILILILE